MLTLPLPPYCLGVRKFDVFSKDLIRYPLCSWWVMWGILRTMLNKSRSSPKHHRRMKLNLETEFSSASVAETKHQDSEFVRRCVRSMRMAIHWGVFISSGGICLILWCNISRRSKDAVGLKEERDCESKSTSHSSHASMSTHINIYFIMKIIRENYKRFPKEPHAGCGRHLSHQANIIWQKGRALESGHVWALLFADHRAQQRSICIQICTAWWETRRWEARALLIILQPFLQSWLWMNQS